MSTEETNTDDVVAKYKKLLSLARSSLESNQATIAAKDKQIHQLIAALEEEKASRLKKGNAASGKEDDVASTPRHLVRRIDVGQSIWVLIEYEGLDDAWKEFNSEQGLDDFISRTVGVPLIKPPRCLNPTESRIIEEEAKKRVDLITEEFRRYKVRSEIVRKQKDVESKQVLTHGGSITSSPSNSSLDSASLDTASPDELRRYKQQLQEQESKWRSAFERAMKENEQLRARSSDSALISQLREQNETCLREKNDLVEKLKIYEKVLHDSPAGIGGGKSLEQSYVELRDEYREFRRRVQAIETQRQIEEDLKGHNPPQRNGSKDKDTRLPSTASSPRDEPQPVNTSSSSTSDARESTSMLGNGWASGNSGLMESKVKYIRQMVYQYLSCKDSEVKLHIESALMAIFRFNDQEREVIDERKTEESQDTLTSITNFLGAFGTT